MDLGEASESEHVVDGLCGGTSVRGGKLRREKRGGFSGSGEKVVCKVKMVGRVAFACAVGPIALAIHGMAAAAPIAPAPASEAD